MRAGAGRAAGPGGLEPARLRWVAAGVVDAGEVGAADVKMALAGKRRAAGGRPGGGAHPVAIQSAQGPGAEPEGREQTMMELLMSCYEPGWVGGGGRRPRAGMTEPRVNPESNPHLPAGDPPCPSAARLRNDASAAKGGWVGRRARSCAAQTERMRFPRLTAA